MAAAPVESPEVRNKGPSIDVFHSGLALNAENKIIIKKGCYITVSDSLLLAFSKQAF